MSESSVSTLPTIALTNLNIALTSFALEYTPAGVKELLTPDFVAKKVADFVDTFNTPTVNQDEEWIINDEEIFTDLNEYIYNNLTGDATGDAKKQSDVKITMENHCECLFFVWAEMWVYDSLFVTSHERSDITDVLNLYLLENYNDYAKEKSVLTKAAR
tara:strand:- start:25 stop:501 length:477 start_codon:yes stop_codon:yes gene_type:complete